jgi:acetyl esterase/lipase
MDAELAAIVPHLPDLDLADVPAARAAGAALMAAGPRAQDAGLTEEEHTVPADPAVPVTVHRPRSADGPLPAIVVVHGGGFALGNRDSTRALCLQLAAQVPAVVVNVEYRLAPENPYPAAVDDVTAVVRWVACGGLPGVDPARLVVHGSSAGAAIAAGAVLRGRDEGGPSVAYQVLVNPVTDDRLDSASMRRFTDTPMWDAGKCAQMWASYLGASRPDPVPAYAAPARADDLSGLPPAFVLTAELDPLRDEGLDYARRMLEAGVSVELHNVADVVHGFGSLPVAIARRWAAAQVEALRRVVAVRPA